jgi:hypothetical protein
VTKGIKKQVNASSFQFHRQILLQLFFGENPSQPIWAVFNFYTFVLLIGPKFYFNRKLSRPFNFSIPAVKIIDGTMRSDDVRRKFLQFMIFWQKFTKIIIKNNNDGDGYFD